MASFDFLSTELKLNVIDYLGRTQPAPSLFDDAPSHATRKEETTAAQKKAADDAVFKTLLNLSCVNRELRRLVGPHLFANVTLSNSNRGGSSVGCISRSPAAAYVRTLHYKTDISALPADIIPAYGSGTSLNRSAVPWAPDHFPDAVVDVLENLGRFDRLEKLIVEFTIETEKLETMQYCIGDFGSIETGEAESDEDAAKAEETQAWRALMRRVYLAIAGNPPGTVKHLELRHLIPKIVRAWHDPTWHVMLEHLEGFSLSLRNFGLHMHVSITPEFRKLAHRLPVYFFDHLHRTTSFEFGCENGGIGAEDFSTTRFSFFEQHTPMLQHLTLSTILISKQLRDTLCAKKALKTIRLIDCAAVDTSNLMVSSQNPHEISWAEFFESLRQKTESQLCAVEVKIRTLQKEIKFYGDELRIRLSDTPWLYGCTADKYGDLVLMGEETAERWNMGEDTRAWQRLLRDMEQRKLAV